MFARIRHVAIITENYQRMAKFYQTIFGMKKITSGMTDEKGDYNPDRGHISDGVIGMALLQRHPGNRSGIDHYGFEVRDIDTLLGRVKARYPELRVITSLEHVPFSVARMLDPAGTHIDVSQQGVAKVREGYLEGGWDQPRQLSHVAIRSADPAKLAEFYRTVFELKPVEGSTENGGFCLTDGKVSVAILPCGKTSYKAMTEGLDHIGFKVESLEKTREEVDALSKSSPESAPRKIDIGRFGPTTKKELEACAMGQHPTTDPDGNLLDLVE
jgi:catechol 2,3-dioxygenase-like lactoylglutathione lyase family enzyme